MTKNDFYKIIYESFDHLDTPQSYFEGKRKLFDILPQEYAAGLKKSFELIKKIVNQTDFARAERITSNDKCEFHLYEYGQEIQNEEFKTLALKGELSFPFKKILNLVKFINEKYGLIESFPPILTPHQVVARFDSENIGKIESKMYNYLLTIDTPAPPQQQEGKSGITIKKKALFMVYNGDKMDQGRSNLHQKFNYYSKTCNRKGTGINCTAKILRNRIQLQKEVIEMLPEPKRVQAEDELKILLNIYESKSYS